MPITRFADFTQAVLYRGAGNQLQSQEFVVAHASTAPKHGKSAMEPSSEAELQTL